MYSSSSCDGWNHFGLGRALEFSIPSPRSSRIRARGFPGAGSRLRVAVIKPHFQSCTTDCPPSTLNVEAWVWSSDFFHLLWTQRLVHFLHVHQFFDSEDLACDVRGDRMIDCSQTLMKPQRLEHARCFPRKAYGTTKKGDAEVSAWSWHIVVVSDRGEKVEDRVL